MPRFFIEESSSHIAILKGEERHHLVNVYRAFIGMEVRLFDGYGNEYVSKITSIGKRDVTLEIVSKTYQNETYPIKIHLAQSMIKSKSWDIILQKSMELGLYKLLPVITQHIGGGVASSGKPERWKKILLSSAKQCGRNSLTKITKPIKFSEFIKESKNFSLKLIAHRNENVSSLRSILEQHPEISEVLVLIGPEGGFSEEELDTAKAEGFEFFTLGSYTLRAETAAISVISSINFYYS